MNETMIDNWNSTVDDSIIFVLGDFCHKGIEGILKRLNGYIILVLGNHDMEFVEEYKRLGVPIFQNYQLKVQEKDLWLSHYAHRVWHKSSVGSWHLYGHTHGQLEEVGLSFDVCTELYMYKPVSINQVESKMRLKLA
ncbi:MAG: hypothetical protein NTZ16_16325 [Verrucomicrobia bacterium]|nr:hypothetical protein [Verrucomicrobiota bacterium]